MAISPGELNLGRLQSLRSGYRNIGEMAANIRAEKDEEERHEEMMRMQRRQNLLGAGMDIAGMGVNAFLNVSEAQKDRDLQQDLQTERLDHEQVQADRDAINRANEIRLEFELSEDAAESSHGRTMEINALLNGYEVDRLNLAHGQEVDLQEMRQAAEQANIILAGKIDAAQAETLHGYALELAEQAEMFRKAGDQRSAAIAENLARLEGEINSRLMAEGHKLDMVMQDDAQMHDVEQTYRQSQELYEDRKLQWEIALLNAETDETITGMNNASRERLASMDENERAQFIEGLAFLEAETIGKHLNDPNFFMPREFSDDLIRPNLAAYDGHGGWIEAIEGSTTDKWDAAWSVVVSNGWMDETQEETARTLVYGSGYLQPEPKVGPTTVTRETNMPEGVTGWERDVYPRVVEAIDTLRALRGDAITPEERSDVGADLELLEELGMAMVGPGNRTFPNMENSRRLREIARPHTGAGSTERGITLGYLQALLNKYAHAGAGF